MQSLLSIPRVWDTSQQAIFNRHTAGREDENTEKGTLFLCLLRKFFPHLPLQRNFQYAKKSAKEKRRNPATLQSLYADKNEGTLFPRPVVVGFLYAFCSSRHDF